MGGRNGDAREGMLKTVEKFSVLPENPGSLSKFLPPIQSVFGSGKSVEDMTSALTSLADSSKGEGWLLFSRFFSIQVPNRNGVPSFLFLFCFSEQSRELFFPPPHL